jgi:hypothetical protein
MDKHGALSLQTRFNFDLPCTAEDFTSGSWVEAVASPKSKDLITGAVVVAAAAGGSGHDDIPDRAMSPEPGHHRDGAGLKPLHGSDSDPSIASTAAAAAAGGAGAGSAGGGAGAGQGPYKVIEGTVSGVVKAITARTGVLEKKGAGAGGGGAGAAAADEGLPTLQKGRELLGVGFLSFNIEGDNRHWQRRFFAVSDSRTLLNYYARPIDPDLVSPDDDEKSLGSFELYRCVLLLLCFFRASALPCPH